MKKVSVLFVCLGNICRSPTAEAVMRKKVADAGLTHLVTIDSAGTAAYHVGKAPDPRSIEAAATYGYDLRDLTARQAVVEDFDQFDYVLALDGNNLEDLKHLAGKRVSGHLGLLLQFAGHNNKSVPDPYYGGDQGFVNVIELCEAGCDGLIEHIQQDLNS